MNYWLMKSEPHEYGWDDLVAEKEGIWDGVRNHQAANNLRAMEKGDRALFYHSGKGPEAVGIVEVSAAGLIDPTDETGKWPTVKVKPIEKLAAPVSLKAMKADPKLADLAIVRQSRLSVAPVREAEWKAILALAGE